MNQIGSTYGTWAACGEITIMEFSTDDNIWRGYLTFGGEYPNQVYYPHDDAILKIDPRQWQIIGLQWTPQRINWIYNGSVAQRVNSSYASTSPTNSNDQICGDVVQTVNCDKWYSLTNNGKNNNTNNVIGVNQKSDTDCRCKIPAPAPFDERFHIVMEMTTTTSRPLSASTLVDWVKLYHQPTRQT
jgi:hypothetical protein